MSYMANSGLYGLIHSKYCNKSLFKFLFILCLIFSFSKPLYGNKCMQSKNIKEQRLSIIPNNPRWAIVCLAKRPDGLSKRNTKLAAAIKPYAKRHDITIIVFSEKKMTSKHLDSWKLTFNDTAKVKMIDTYDRGFINPLGIEKERIFAYRYMCKFFTIDLYDYLIDNYDYYMRIDADDYITKMDVDLFQWTIDNKIEYGFPIRKIEGHAKTRNTFPKWIENYMKACEFEAKAIMDRPLSTCFHFYNNFHIGKVSFFSRPDVQHYLKAVNDSGKIQENRWGDSTIQAYAIRLFMDPIKIRMIPDLIFVHGSHGHRMINTTNKGSSNTLPFRLDYWVDPSIEEEK